MSKFLLERESALVELLRAECASMRAYQKIILWHPNPEETAKKILPGWLSFDTLDRRVKYNDFISPARNTILKLTK